MSLLSIWSKALDCIVQKNDGEVCKSVDAERQRIEDERREIEQKELRGRSGPSFRPGLANEIRQRHEAVNIEKLRDYAAYLIWAKLTRNWSGLPDKFLGITDLQAYLSAWVPDRYEQSQVDEFVSSLGPPTPLGDLRSFLCGRQNVSWQLYRHQELNDFLMAFQGEIDGQLREVWRGIPSSIVGWAAMIADQLVTGSCDCSQGFSQTPNAYSNACRRCRDYHFLAKENLDRGRRLRLYQQKKPMANSLEYVERAVIEKIGQIRQKNFAKTMLCNVFETPGGNKLRLGS